MIRILTVDNMRKSDAATIAAGIPGRELMRRAGVGIFRSTTWTGPVGIVCGSGNNAGDGYVLALLLQDAGIACELLLLSEKLSDDGRYYFEKCVAAGIPVRELFREEAPFDLSAYETIADCIFGTGFHGTAEGICAEAIRAIGDSGACVVSVDINSGLSGKNGMAGLGGDAPCVHSDLTVSIGDYQPGHFLNMAKDVMKERVNIGIGIEPADPPFGLLEEADAAKVILPRKNLSNKGSCGYIALIGGSGRYGGAIRLAEMANAAMRSGAGVVKLAVPGFLLPGISPLILESTLFPLAGDEDCIAYDEAALAELIRGVKCVAFGMGIGSGEGAAKTLDYLLANVRGTLLLDADGLNLLSKKESYDFAAKTLVLTPHLKEFSRLSGLSVPEILEDPIGHAVNYAKARGVILLLKGPTTIITDGKEVLLTDAGCPGMATAGSGDVLSGILSAILGFAEDPLLGTATGAYVNGRAGELAQEEMGSVAMVAGDTVRHLPEIIKRLERS